MADDEDEHLNSSDQEYEVVRPHFRAGNASIASMMEKRYEDRMESKKALREQADTRGAPGAIYLRTLWLHRSEAYAAMNNFCVDTDKGPDGDLIYRFMKTIATHIEPNYAEKPVVQARTMKHGLLQLVAALDFKNPQFKLSKHDAARIDALLADVVKAGKLLPGRWSKPQWVGIALFEKMARAWLQSGWFCK